MATTSTGQPDRKRKLLRLVVIGTGAVLLAWLSFAVTVDRALGERLPEAALTAGLGGSSAAATSASNLAVAGASPAELAQARTLALRALEREPVSVPAIRTLATIAAYDGDLDRADRLMAYSQQVSRRDLPTQLWLIEERVRNNDIAGALVHYDRALRTSRRARPVLFPVLVSAVSYPQVAEALAPMLAQRVGWGPDFLAVMTQAPNASPDALGRLLFAAQLRPHVPLERDSLDMALDRLVATGRYQAAYTAYLQATGTDGDRVAVRNGGFEADTVLPPFDWTLTNAANVFATLEPNETGTALALRTAAGGTGELARQLLVLAPNTYRLSLVSAQASPDAILRANVVVACPDGRELLSLPLSAVERRRLTGQFTVPGGCGAQWLTIVAPAGLGDGGNGVLVDDLTIEPARR